MKNILPIHMGGTIGSIMSEGGAKPGIGFSALYKKVFSKTDKNHSDLANDISVAEALAPIGEYGIHSSTMQISHIRKLAETIIMNYDRYDGFVVTHGTDTMAFTTSFLSFALRNIRKPIVVTGSQKLLEEPNSDAFTNLRDAFILSSRWIGGVWLVFNGKIIPGVNATKIDTESPGAFVSTKKNEIKIENIRMNPPENNGKTIFFTNFSDEVDIFYLSQMITADTLGKYLSIRKPKALLVLAYGLGGQRVELWDTLGEWVDNGNIVVLKSQCVYGVTDPNKYEVGRKALDRGILSAGSMSLEASIAKLSYMVGSSIRDSGFFSKDLVGEYSN